MTGEATPYYLFHPLAPARVAELLPEARLIVLLRDPIDRAFSHHNHERALGFEELDFEAALEAEAGRLLGEEERLLADPSYRSFSHQHHSYLSRGRYAAQLERWFECCGEERILVLSAEDLFTQPAAVVGEAQEFLGLPAQTPVDLSAKNARSYAPIPAATRDRLSRDFAADNERLRAAAGPRLRLAVSDDADRQRRRLGAAARGHRRDPRVLARRRRDQPPRRWSTWRTASAPSSWRAEEGLPLGLHLNLTTPVHGGRRCPSSAACASSARLSTSRRRGVATPSTPLPGACSTAASPTSSTAFAESLGRAATHADGHQHLQTCPTVLSTRSLGALADPAARARLRARPALLRQAGLPWPRQPGLEARFRSVCFVSIRDVHPAARRRRSRRRDQPGPGPRRRGDGPSRLGGRAGGAALRCLARGWWMKCRRVPMRI